MLQIKVYIIVILLVVGGFGLWLINIIKRFKIPMGEKISGSSAAEKADGH